MSFYLYTNNQMPLAFTSIMADRLALKCVPLKIKIYFLCIFALEQYQSETSMTLTASGGAHVEPINKYDNIYKNIYIFHCQSHSIVECLFCD